MSAPLMDPTRAAEKYEHGTRARYHLGKCRCFPCKVANSEYEHERLRKRRNPWRTRKVGGKWVVKNIETGEIAPEDIADELLLEQPEDDNELVSTREVVKHIQRLRAGGLGLKAIAKQCGVRYSTLQRMMPGATYRPITRTRRGTAEKILALGRSGLTDGLRVDASFASELIRRLRVAKYKRYWVAEQIGVLSSNLRIWVRPQQWLRLCTVRAIHELYVRLMQTDSRLEPIDPIFVAPAAEPADRRCGYKGRAA